VDNLSALFRFSRPHTIIATSLQVVALFVLSGAAAAGTAALWWQLPLVWVASLCVNIYIVGLNQMADVDIDRINKPYLPLPAGRFTYAQARRIVLVTGVVALALAALLGPYLFLTVGIAFLVGTIYSLPPLHLKRHAFWAALAIAGVRGVSSNLGLYAHFRSEMGLSPAPSLLILWVTLFFFGFGLVIALYKDIPDHDGDKAYTMRTFTVRFGPHRVFRLGRWLMTAFYLVPILFAMVQLPGVGELVLLVTHLAALAFFWLFSLRTDPADTRSVSRFYLSLWGLFYAEYILLMLRELARLASA
jgi:homogentisate phytyltransferase/homogentisate geranylgeranyltransferase